MTVYVPKPAACVPGCASQAPGVGIEGLDPRRSGTGNDGASRVAVPVSDGGARR